MKCKILLLAVIAVFSFSANAQIQKGSTYIGGNFNFSSQKNEWGDQKTNSFFVNPSIGKAIRENFIVGVILNYGNTSSKYYSTPNKTHTTVIGAGVFARKYLNLGSKFYLFGQGALSTSYSDNDYPTNVGTDSKSYIVNLDFYPGIAYEISRSFQLEVGLNDILNLSYQKGTYYPENPNFKHKFSSFGINSSLTTSNWLSVGLRILINKKSR